MFEAASAHDLDDWESLCEKAVYDQYRRRTKMFGGFLMIAMESSMLALAED